jgi:hypothetical protein
MYMDALDIALRQPEIRQAFDEFGISAGSLRMQMLSSAPRIFSSAPREFAAYEDALAQESAAIGADPKQITHGRSWEPLPVLRWAVIGGAVAGAIMIVSGAASSVAWPPMATLAEAGATLVVVAAVIWVSLRLFGANIHLQSLGTTQHGSADLDAARYRLMAAVTETELLAQVRTFVNAARQDRFGHEYSVAGTPGLSEVYDSVNRIPTSVASELEELLGRFDGASIGVAGPRGSGKSTLIRQYCDETSSERYEGGRFEWSWLTGYYLPRRASRDLRCLVAAPVDYVPRDFVLHLFAAFCRAVIDSCSRRARGLPRIVVGAFWLRRTWWLMLSLLWRGVVYGAAAAALLYWDHAIARQISVPRTWVEYAAIALACLGALEFVRSSVPKVRGWMRLARDGDQKTLAATARKHLTRVRYLQTYTSGWSGTLHLPGGGAEGQYSRSVSHAEQPRSYPEIVDEFRGFAREVAAEVHRRHSRVFIGIDELDKIGTAEQAEQFLNEIKGIFGIPHLYFMVSVSDDALTAFDRRGLPLRNAFDSSFDEIIHVGPLSYGESRRLLYRRVIGLSEPYVALCHCLAGGLARDVIRAARQVIRAAVALNMRGSPVISPGEAEDEIADSTAYLLVHSGPEQQPPTLAAISATVVQDELRRKLRAISYVINNVTPESATELHEALYQLSHTLTLGQPIINIVALMARPGQGEPPALTSLRLDFAAYAYYCATLQEVFTDQLDRERMIEATGLPPGPGSFDALAAVRTAFTLDTLLAWRLNTQFRKAWSLETREP